MEWVAHKSQVEILTSILKEQNYVIIELQIYLSWPFQVKWVTCYIY